MAHLTPPSRSVPARRRNHNRQGKIIMWHGWEDPAISARSFAFPDPEKVEEKKPIPFDKDQPFKNLGLRLVNQTRGRAAGVESVTVNDVELAMNEYSGTEGFNQLLKPATF